MPTGWMTMLISPTLAGWVVGVGCALGLVLVAIGVRGRRVGTAECCRRCGYEVGAVAGGGSPRCPECGAALAGPRATVVGLRRRLRPLLVAGAAVVVLAGAWWGGARALRGLGPADKPVWWLRADLAGAATQGAAVNELLMRHQADRVGARARRAIVRRILDVQGDPAMPWGGDLGDLFLAMRGSGDVTERQWLRFVRQSVFHEFTLEVRPAVLAGETSVPYRTGFRLGFRGCASWADRAISPDPGRLVIETFAAEDALRLDGVRLSKPSTSRTGPVAVSSLQTVIVPGVSAPAMTPTWNHTSTTTGAFMFWERADENRLRRVVLEPGKREVTLERHFVISTAEQAEARRSDPSPELPLPDDAVVLQWTERRTARLVALTELEPPALVEDASAALDYAERVWLASITAKPHWDGESQGLEVRVSHAVLCRGPGLAHEAIGVLTLGGVEHEIALGSLRYKPDPESRWCTDPRGTTGPPRSVLFIAAVPEALAAAETLRVVLRPSPEVAANSVDMMRVLDAELDLGEYPIDWGGTPTGPPRPPGNFSRSGPGGR